MNITSITSKIYKGLIISFNGGIIFMAELVSNKWVYMRKISMFNCLGNDSMVENILVG